MVYGWGMVLRAFRSVGELSETGGGITIITVQSQNKQSIDLGRFGDLWGQLWILEEHCSVLGGIERPLVPIRGSKGLLLLINSP